MAEVDARYWRIRMKVGNEHERTREAWDLDEVGIWYGAWTAQDWQEAIQRYHDDPRRHLNSLAAQQDLGWEVTKGYADAAWRFADIAETDWVVVYLRDNQTIGLARVAGKLSSNPNHPLNTDAECFKYRKLKDKKTFEIGHLPDSYMLLGTQGRGNVHQFNSMADHVRLLADSKTETEVFQTFAQMSFDDYIGFMGPSEWESLCVAYLMFEEEFVPTGLRVGRTLSTVDIVERRRSDAARIIAQCKRHDYGIEIGEEFASLSNALNPHDRAFYFAYGGIAGVVPANVVVLTRDDLLRWADTPSGQLYRKLLA
jgi:hypothetical protein